MHAQPLTFPANRPDGYEPLAAALRQAVAVATELEAVAVGKQRG